MATTALVVVQVGSVYLIIIMHKKKAAQSENIDYPHRNNVKSEKGERDLYR
jgi:hypothetical protein